MTVLEKIAALRAAMEAEGADGVYVPSSDPHMTEYLPARWRCRAWLSGFTGSAGTLCVTREAAALWTDGRYFIQAERQLEGSGITLMRMAQPGLLSKLCPRLWQGQAADGKGAHCGGTALFTEFGLLVYLDHLS